MRSRRHLVALVSSLVALAAGALPATARPVKSIGVEMGGSTNLGVDGYGAGLGRGFTFGTGGGAVSVEMLLGYSFSQLHSNNELHAANTTGKTSLLAMTVRFRRIRKQTILSLSGGFARVSVPLLSATSGEPFGVDGLGLLAGAGAALRLSPAVSLTLDLRAVAAIYEVPREIYLEEPVVTGGVVGGSESTRAINALPLFATVGVRVFY